MSARATGRRKGDAGANPFTDACTLAVERTVRDIERELHHHLDAVERIAIERALEQLADDVRANWHPW